MCCGAVSTRHEPSGREHNTFLLVGILMLLLTDTSANLLNLGMSTRLVSCVTGMVIMAAGFHTRVGTLEEACREEG